MTYAKETIRDKKIAVKQWVLGASCRVCVVVLMITLGVMYILETNSLSTKGYEIGDLQRQISALQHENESVEVEIASYRSMNSIQERLKKLSLVDATDAQYVNVVGTAVAER